MAEHYYSSNPDSAHKPNQFTFTIHGREFVFATDAGVFSKEHIDPGSVILLKHTPLRESRRVVDLGCGYGAIGIVVGALLPHARVFMVDPNSRAVGLANRNARLNRVENAQAYCGEGFEPLPAGDFDLVLTNPPIRAGKEVIYGLFSAARERLVPGGRLVVVIRTNQGARSAEEFLKNTFGNVKELERESGYRLLEATRE